MYQQWARVYQIRGTVSWSYLFCPSGISRWSSSKSYLNQNSSPNEWILPPPVTKYHTMSFPLLSWSRAAHPIPRHQRNPSLFNKSVCKALRGSLYKDSWCAVSLANLNLGADCVRAVIELWIWKESPAEFLSASREIEMVAPGSSVWAEWEALLQGRW